MDSNIHQNATESPNVHIGKIEIYAFALAAIKLADANVASPWLGLPSTPLLIRMIWVLSHDQTWQSSSFLSVIPKKEMVVSMDKVKIQNSDI